MIYFKLSVQDYVKFDDAEFFSTVVLVIRLIDSSGSYSHVVYRYSIL